MRGDRALYGSLPFKFNDGLLHPFQGIHNQFDQAAIIDVAAFGSLVKVQDVPDGSLAVGAGSAHVLGNFLGFILEGVQDLEKFFSASPRTKSILSLAAMGFIPVVDPTLNCWTEPFS